MSRLASGFSHLLRGAESAYRLRQQRVNVRILQRERQSSAKAPPAIKGVNGPENSDCILVFRFIREGFDQRILTMEAYLIAQPSSYAKVPPRLALLVSVKAKCRLSGMSAQFGNSRAEEKKWMSTYSESNQTHTLHICRPHDFGTDYRLHGFIYCVSCGALSIFLQ